MLKLLLELDDVFQHKLLLRSVLRIAQTVLRLRTQLELPTALQLLVDYGFAVL